MSVHVVRCPCLGKLECKLCNGRKVYEYEVGPRGWMPFACPTCDGRGTLTVEGGAQEPCITCHGEKIVDPAFPPPDTSPLGMLRKIWKILFGG
jgi:hypothetical protein